MNRLRVWRLRRRLVKRAVETYRAVEIAERFFESGKGRSGKELQGVFPLSQRAPATRRQPPRPPQT